MISGTKMRPLMLLFLAAVSVVSAQEAPNPPLKFSTTTRLVQVDIVVTDKDGAPVRGLQASDFVIMQDGKRQAPSFFEVHGPLATAPDKTVAPSLPANVFSNQPKGTTSPSWTILLLDLLNTPTPDQMTARKQLIKMIHSLPAGQSVALFTLTSQLTLVQGFSSQPDALLAALKDLKIVPSKLLTTEGQRQQIIGDLAYMSNTSRPPIPGNSSVNVSGFGDRTGGGGVSNVSRWMQGYNQMEAIRADARAIFTLDALSAISRAVSGYPDRKNLVWLSGGFPVRLGPDAGGIDPWRNSKDYSEALNRASSLLSDSRVAVYPVDIRGSQTRGVSITASTSASGVYTGIVVGDAPNTISTDGMTNLLAEQTVNSLTEHETLLDIAKQTGGRAFVNTNDFGDATLRSISDGTTYYTIAFAPPKTDEKNAYHAIEVKLDRPNTKLSYRHGYYSSTYVIESPQVGAAALQGALQPGMPPATTLLFSVQVQPPGPGRRNVVLQYTINPANLHFSDDVNGIRKVVVDCMAIAFDSKGKPVALVSDSMEGSIKTAHFDEALQKGIPATQELQLPAGTYYLKTGIMDRNSSQIGTLDIPLVVPLVLN
jgi:VWFA-related protein